MYSNSVGTIHVPLTLLQKYTRSQKPGVEQAYKSSRNCKHKTKRTNTCIILNYQKKKSGNMKAYQGILEIFCYNKIFFFFALFFLRQWCLFGIQRLCCRWEMCVCNTNACMQTIIHVVTTVSLGVICWAEGGTMTSLLSNGCVFAVYKKKNHEVFDFFFQFDFLFYITF